MKQYIQNLREIFEKNPSQPNLKCTNNTSQKESLEIQIQRWWKNLPPVLQYRQYQITEIAIQCKGRYKGNPALREVAAALRALGWEQKRDWTNQGRNKRFWSPKI